MRLKKAISINGKEYEAGAKVPIWFVYPFFLVHMGMFGLSGFAMAYMDDGPGLAFLYMHGGFAIFVYLIFYLAIFGRDEVKWMLINAGLGLFGIWVELDYILGWFGKSLDEFSPLVHVIPFLYYVLYTFLLRHLVLDLTGSRHDPARRRIAEFAYVAVSLAIYVTLYLL